MEAFGRLTMRPALECSVTGTVDRVDRVTQFTALEVRAHLKLPSGANEEQARRPRIP